MVNEMVSDDNALKSVFQDKKEMVLFKDNKIIPEMKYYFVCDEDYTYPLGGGVKFKAGVPKRINGLFGKNIVKLTKGKVYFQDKSLWSDSTADSSRDDEIKKSKDEIADLKAQVAALIKLSLEPKEEVVVKNAIPKEVVAKAAKGKSE
jgi:hypothetical protein